MLNKVDLLPKARVILTAKCVASMEFYQYDRTWIEQLGLEDNHHNVCGILKMTSFGAVGWAEYQKDEWGLVRKQLAEEALLALCQHLLDPVSPQNANMISLERNILIDRSISYYSF